MPPHLGTHDWSALGMRGVTFDEHRVGHVLAARLWSWGEPTLYLQALRGCPNGTSSGGTPGAQLDAWASGCPAAVSGRLRAALAAWLPEELH